MLWVSQQHKSKYAHLHYLTRQSMLSAIHFLNVCMDRLFRLFPRVRNRIVLAKPDLSFPAIHDVLNEGLACMLSLELPNPSRIPQLACDS